MVPLPELALTVEAAEVEAAGLLILMAEIASR
jgi:hypothetical protein